MSEVEGHFEDIEGLLNEINVKIQVRPHPVVEDDIANYITSLEVTLFIFIFILGVIFEGRG